MRFRAELMLHGKTATGFEVPPEIVEGLGGGKRPAVTVTLRGYTYRNTIAPMGGKHLLGVSAEHRAQAGVQAGDVVDVDVELDTAPREVVVPDDLAAALAADDGARAAFERLSYSNQRGHVASVEGAKTPQTRQRRIDKVIAGLRDMIDPMSALP